MRKGMSIPINTIVILAMALIVLLGIVAFFTGSFSTPANSVKCRSQLSAACQSFASNGGCEKDATASDVTSKLVDAINCTKGWTWNPTDNDDKLETAKTMCCLGLESK